MTAFLGSFLSLVLVGCAPAPLPPLRVEVVEPDARLPVAIEISPKGRLFYALQRGAVFMKDLQPDANGDFPKPVPLIDSIAVAIGNESGLLGLALAPDFSDSRHFYLYYTVSDADGEPVSGRIVRYTEIEGEAVGETVIVGDLPAWPGQLYHFGGGLTIGPDGKLYLIFGDTNRPERAADPGFPEGSVLRYNLDGTIPADNPFPGSPVFAYGIRNGFGLAFHPATGALYQTENGERCDDELNRIDPGADYGWGVYAFNECPYPDDHASPPLHEWTPPVAPAGLAFYTGELIPEFQGDLLVCTFNTAQLLQVVLSVDGRSVESVQALTVDGRERLCRIAVVEGPGGWLYTSTDREILRIGR